MVCTLERCQFSTVLIRFTGNWRKISDENFEGAAVLMDPGFDLTTRDLYFTILDEVFTNHILAENTYFTNHIE